MDPTSARADELLAQMGWVRKLARRLVRDESTADDVAQTTWVLATERPPLRAQSGPGLRAWLAAVTRTLARQTARSDRRRKAREVHAQPPTDAKDPSDVVARGALHKRVSDLVMAMEEPTRSTLLYAFVDGLSSREIAARMKVSPAAVRQRTSRGVQKLREALRADPRDWSMALLTLAWPGGAPLSVLVQLSLKALGGFLMAKRIAVGVAIVLLSLGVAWPLSSWVSGSGDAVADATVQKSVTPEKGTAPETPISEVRSEVGTAPTLAIVDSADRPIANARVVFVRDGVITSPVTTGPVGTVPRTEGAERAIVAAAGYIPQPFDLARGPTTLRMRDGARIAGQLLVDGKPASPGTEIVVRTESTIPAVEELGAELVGALEREKILFDRVTIAVKARGEFALRGLESTFAGKLSLPKGLGLVRTSSGTYPEFGSVVVMAPVENLVIHAVHLPWVRGRAIWESDGSPAAGALLWIVGHFEDCRSSDPVTIYTDSNGRFELPLQAYIYGDDPASLVVRSVGVARFTKFVFGSVGRKYALIPAEKISATGDVGDVELEDSDQTRILVVDRAGEPLVGALVNYTRDGKLETSRAAGRGGTTLRNLPKGEVELTAQADGYRNRTTKITVDKPSTLHRITLERSARLRFVVARSRDLIQSEMRLDVEADSDLFAPSTPDGRAHGGKKLTFLVDQGGIALTDPVPGLRLRLTLRDFLGQVITRKEVVAPRAGEWSDCHIAIPSTQPTVDGTVVDQDGVPVPGAQVTLYDTRGSLGAVARSNTRGEFSFPLHLPANHFALTVSHAAFIVSSERLGDERTVRVELQRGREVIIRVEDESGRAMIESRARCRVGSSTGGGVTRVGPATFLCRNVPPGSGDAEARVFGANYSTPIAPDTREVTVRVPVHGTLRLEIDKARTVPERTRLVLRGKHEKSRFSQPIQRGFEEWLVPPMTLLPGRWTLQLVQEGPGRKEINPLGEPGEVQVNGNGVTRYRM